MYLGFYGLDREPFHITPDPQFLFLSPSHKEAFASMVYGVESRKGFVEVTGEVGTGKTTILRAYLEQVDADKVRSLYLFNPDLSFDELLQYLLHEMGIEDSKGPASVMLQSLHMALIEEYRLNRNVVLIIDEAQNMPMETIEKLRMLSNLETTRDKLIQIVLVGQPELEKKLNMHELRQLKQRIAVRVAIRPLSDAESHAYVQHRLTQAGCKFGDIFAAPALKAIVKRAQGIPRTINILCDNALIAGFGAQQMPVSLPVVKEVIADLNVRPQRPYLKWGVAALAAALILTVAGVLFTRQPAGGERTLLPQSLAAASEEASRPAPAEPLSETKDIVLEKMLKVARAKVDTAPKPPQESVAPVAPPVEPVEEPVSVSETAPMAEPVMEVVLSEEAPQEAAEPTEPEAVPETPLPEEPVVAAAPAQAEPEPEPVPLEQEALSVSEEAPAPETLAQPEDLEQVASSVAGETSAEPAEPEPASLEVEEPEPVVRAQAEPAEGSVPEEVSAPEEDVPAVAEASSAEPESASPEEEEPEAVVLAQAEPGEVPVPEEAPAPEEDASAVAEASSAEPGPLPERPVSMAVPFGGGISVAASRENAWSPHETSRLVQKGDCLSWLISDVYGFCNSDMIDMVTQRNPKIQNPHRILTGDTLIFPEVDAREGTAETAATEPPNSATADR